MARELYLQQNYIVLLRHGGSGRLELPAAAFGERVMPAPVRS